jgi:D-arabinose 1-dehydrogenase-like Zn-dependent alcohol dehydrogenase
MKAIRVHSYGQPPRLDDVPEPTATGPDDVIIRVGGAGLCPTDLHIIDGWLADLIPAELPLVLGHENAGWVHAVGPAVEHVTVGDPVICHPNLTCGVCGACRSGDDMRCGRGPSLPGVTCAGGIPLILGEISIVANLIGTHADLAGLVALAGQDRVRLRSTSYPLEAVGDAVEDLRRGRIHGRAILTPG